MPSDISRHLRKRPPAVVPDRDPLDTLIRAAARTASPRVRRWLSKFRRGERAEGIIEEVRP